MTIAVLIILLLACIGLLVRIRKLERIVQEMGRSLLRQENRINAMAQQAPGAARKEEAPPQAETFTPSPEPTEKAEAPAPAPHERPPERSAKRIRAEMGDSLSGGRPDEAQESPSERPVDRALREIEAASRRNEPVRAQTGNEAWARMEKQFIENWTGIVGAVVMVMGVSFLGIYAALKMNPFYRFVMIILFAAFLFGGHIFLGRKSMWLRAASWVRSSSGAIFLFACFGSHAIEGLKWIYDPGHALMFLSLGIAVNLWFGFAGRTQVFASLHVILSLVALGIGPQSLTTLIITAVVSLIGVAMSYRARWEHHLLVAISAFLAYQVFWYNSQDLTTATITIGGKATGILATLAVGITACLVHYRKLYMARKFEPSAFGVHVMNWTYMATGLMLYSTGSKWNTVILGGTAMVAALLARYARRIGIRWLYTTDTLVAEAIGLFALFTLNRWHVDWFVITAVIYTEVLLFLAVMIKEKEDLLGTIGVWLHYASAGAVMIGGIALASRGGHMVVSDLTILGIIIVLESVFHHYSVAGGEVTSDRIDLVFERYRFPVHFGGLVIPVFMLIFFARISHYLWAASAIGGLGVLALIWRQRIQSNGLAFGMAVFLVGMHIIGWREIDMHLSGNIGRIAVYGIPLFAVSAAGIYLSYMEALKRSVRWPCIYIFTAHLAFFSYFATVPLSPYIPGVLWITLSAVYLHVSVRLAGGAREGEWSTCRSVLFSGAAFVVLFFVVHIVVHMQPGPYIGFLPVRLLIEMLGFIVLFYWASTRWPERVEEDFIRKVHPLWWEVLVGFYVFTIVVELSSRWHPLAWVLSASSFFVAGVAFKQDLSRFRFYSLLFSWAGCFHAAVISGLEPVPSHRWSDQAWVGAAAALMLQLVYLAVFYRRDGLKDISFPAPLAALQRMTAGMQERRTVWVFYPTFAAIAVFLYWTFDRSLLTVMWVLESFLVFILSVVLRQNHFRYVSMAALACCLVRLVFFDLARSATITRALVFLSVGVIMLLINILYNKYRGRFEG